MDRSSRNSSQSTDPPLRSSSIREREHGRKYSEDWDSKPMTNEPRILAPRQSVAPSLMGVVRSLVSTAHQLQEQAGQYWEIAAECLQKSAQVGQDYFDKSLMCASTLVGQDPAAAHEALGKAWSWGVEVSTQLWEKVKPQIIDYMPEDRSPLLVCSVVVLVFCLAIAGLTTDVKRTGASKNVNVDIFPITAQRIQLPDGRHIAYRECGVAPDMARHSVLVVHGFPSSRLAGIPGIKDELLEEFGVRLIAYDRPGFGESDAHPRRSLRTSAQDMAFIADTLGLGEKFWVLGHSTGGIHGWAALKYIPERLAGVGLFAPGGNLYAPNMTKEEIKKVWGGLTLRRKLTYMIARRVPSLLPSFYQRTLIKKVDKFKSGLSVTVGKKDQALVEQGFFMEALDRDVCESIRQGNAATLAEELVMQVRPWGFHLSDLRMRKKSQPGGLLQRLKGLWKKEEEEWEGFTGPIHIWQGSDDRLVPLAINEFASRMVPQATLHKLEGEGHFSYFFFCDRCHREILETLLGSPEEPKDPATTVEPKDPATTVEPLLSA